MDTDVEHNMADDGFRYFRSKVTGLVGRYPAHFSFLDDLTEVSAEEAQCIDCYIDPDGKPVETVKTDARKTQPVSTHDTKDTK